VDLTLVLFKWSSVRPDSELHLPPVNEFIPTDVSLKPREAEVYLPRM
jgi:secreted Zn-dependent insulinase-like peptidase